MRQYTSGTSKVYWMQRSRERKHVADAATPGASETLFYFQPWLI
jgi:hypothetical protein